MEAMTIEKLAQTLRKNFYDWDERLSEAFYRITPPDERADMIRQWGELAHTMREAALHFSKEHGTTDLELMIALSIFGKAAIDECLDRNGFREVDRLMTEIDGVLVAWKQ